MSPTNFFSLPAELRIQIYTLVLVRKDRISVWYESLVATVNKYGYSHETASRSTHHTGLRHFAMKAAMEHFRNPNGNYRRRTSEQWSKRVEGLDLNLLLCNYRCSREAAAIFYGQNEFTVCFKWNWSIFKMFLDKIGPANRGHLRRLAIVTGTSRWDRYIPLRTCECCNSRALLGGSSPCEFHATAVKDCFQTIGRVGAVVDLTMYNTDWGPFPGMSFGSAYTCHPQIHGRNNSLNSMSSLTERRRATQEWRDFMSSDYDPGTCIGVQGRHRMEPRDPSILIYVTLMESLRQLRSSISTIRPMEKGRNAFP